MPDFGRMFLKLKYTDIIPKHLYPMLNGYGDNDERKVWSSCGYTYSTWFAWRITVHCACPSFSLQPAQAYKRCDCTCKVLGTL